MATNACKYGALSVIDGRLRVSWTAEAIISALDLVVTIDTAIAHLAGAMGKPVWVLIPGVADWRWMERRTDSPWYPSARLFRQQRGASWDAVVEDVLAALEARQALGA